MKIYATRTVLNRVIELKLNSLTTMMILPSTNMIYGVYIFDGSTNIIRKDVGATHFIMMIIYSFATLYITFPAILPHNDERFLCRVQNNEIFFT